LEKGILTILVADAAYAYHLRFFKSKILDLIASPEICGENIVRDITYFVGPLPKWKKMPNRSQTKSKKVEWRKKRIDSLSQKTASVIGELELKKRFSRFMHSKTSGKTQSK
ncbi:MAG: DUF721 domain-containing protein, partial [Proteobacteria bacterium]|nr:DUF721 domain-containing protein [Pseudomonadota bacterium]